MYIAAVVNWYAGVFCLSVNERSGRPAGEPLGSAVGKRRTDCGKSLEFLSSISRLGIARASAALLIWLNENVPLYASLNSAADGSLRGNSRNSGVLCFFVRPGSEALFRNGEIFSEGFILVS